MAQASEPELQHNRAAAECQELQFSHTSIHKQHFREGIQKVKVTQNTLHTGVNACIHISVLKEDLLFSVNLSICLNLFVLKPAAGMQP